MAFNWRNIFSLRRSPPSDPSYQRGFGFTKTGLWMNDDMAMKVAAFYRGVIYISTQIAKLPWETKNSNFEIVEDGLSALLDLAPNDEMNAFFFRVWSISEAIQRGNSYAEIERNFTGRAIAMHPIVDKSVELKRDAAGKLYYEVGPGRYSYDRGNSTRMIRLDPKDVFHVRNFHTKDGLVGQGLAAWAAETLGIQVSADRMAGGIFANGGVPSGVIEVTGSLSPEAHERLKSTWNSMGQGSKAGGTRILENGYKYTPVKIEADVLQFLDSRKFGVLEIARFLGLPPTKLMDNQATTFSNVENANLEVATDTLDAWCRNLESEADIKILNKRYGGRYSEIDLSKVFRGDLKTQSDYYKSMMSVAAMTPNQIRALDGKAPYPGGDKYYIANNNYAPVDRLDEIIDAQITSKTKSQDPGQPPKESEEERELNRAAITYLNSKK
jgi:HK97 family phage portal protein